MGFCCYAGGFLSFYSRRKSFLVIFGILVVGLDVLGGQGGGEGGKGDEEKK